MQSKRFKSSRSLRVVNHRINQVIFRRMRKHLASVIFKISHATRRQNFVIVKFAAYFLKI